jgi:hypothetical protein
MMRLLSALILLIFENSSYSRQINVALVPFTPLNSCPDNTNALYSQIINETAKNPSGYNGFDIDLLG